MKYFQIRKKKPPLFPVNFLSKELFTFFYSHKFTAYTKVMKYKNHLNPDYNTNSK